MKTLLDIGCNDLAGFRLLSTMESLQDRRKIFVEANPECWDDLEKDLGLVTDASLIKKAVSFDNNPVSLVTRKDEKKCTGATIMGDEFFKDSLGRWGIVAESVYHTVPAITLSQIIAENEIYTPECILKLDAEGIEYNLLEWIFGQGILFEKIYCEFHVHNSTDQSKKDQLIGKLKSRNYQIFEWH
jgi:FkbM family methyltransferase